MVGLFLVLAIQLLQVQSALAVTASTVCAPAGKSSCCCSGKDHCPCAKSAPVKESKSPLSQVSGETKAPEFIEPCGGIPAQGLSATFSPEPRHALPGARLPIGYQGVSLSVAFCRFVI